MHFLFLGIALFALASYFGDTAAIPDNNQIVVSEGKILSLASIFRRTWQRPPTEAELDGLIQDYINEEVFYREALEMGLDQDDTIIRRRLRQKLEFVAEDLADAVEPTEEQLTEYLSAHADRYRLEGRTSFIQVYFSPDRRGDSLSTDAQQILKSLQQDEAAVNLEEVGDPILLPINHENLRDQELANLFGRGFPQALASVQVGTWTGPVKSSYGLHLVKVTLRKPGNFAKLEQVRDVVRRDWFAQRRAESKQQFYDGLVKRYQIVIQMPADAADTPRQSEQTNNGSGNESR